MNLIKEYLVVEVFGVFISRRRPDFHVRRKAQSLLPLPVLSTSPAHIDIHIT